MRSYWSSQPMLRVAFALIGGLTLGILVMDNAPLSAVLLWGMAGITLSCLLCIIVAGRNIRLNQLTGLALTLFIVAAGYIFCWLGIDKNFNNYFAYHLSASPVLKVCIDKPPVEHQKTITTIARVLAVDSAGKLLRVSGKMQLVFLKDSSSLKPEYGDVLLIRAKIDTISGPKNPFEFNFNRYFGYHNIFYSAFLKKGDFKNTGENKGSSALAFVYKIRAHLLAVIQTYVPDGNNLGVASAIMLGYTNYENADIKRAYASAGVIHILSVSGLHVGVMFLMLNFLLGWMDKYGARFKIAKTLTVV
ncbi:MAG TPA: ComEC family competence protein, partial [Chitinophagales bacterium]|nr:ComEC family competence protein [Chitinophagales bacterium]